MKQVLFLCLFGLSVADKLDRTYLPPSNAATAGGSNLLSTPYQINNGGFNRFQQPNSVYANNGFSRGQSDLPSPNNPYTRPSNQPQYTSSKNNYGSKGFTSVDSQTIPKYSGGQRFTGSSGSNAGFSPSSFHSYPPSNILRYSNQNNGDGSYQFDFETENKIAQNEAGHIQNAGTDREASVVQGDYSYVAPDGRTIAVKYVADENGFRASGDHIPFTPSAQSGGYPHSNTFNQQSNGLSGYHTPKKNGFAQFGANKGYPSSGVKPSTSSYHDKQFGGPSKPFGSQIGQGNGENAYTTFANKNSIGYAGNLNGAPHGFGQSSQKFVHRPGFSPLNSNVGSHVSRKYLPPS